MEWIIASTALLVCMALLVEEKGWDVYAPIRNAAVDSFTYLGEHNFFGQIITKGLEVRKRELRDQHRKEFKAMLQSRFKDTGIYIGGLYGSGEHSWDSLDLRVMPDELHRTRQILRETFGSWNDTILPGSCTEASDGVFLLRCNYVPKEKLPYYLSIEIDYDIDNLPKGLLKEGCKVETHTETRVTCSVVCR